MPTLADYPEIVAQLDERKNGRVVPGSIRCSSTRVLWWRCPAGHDHCWAASVVSRAVRGHGCPFCAGRAVSATTALSRVAPDIAEQWHPTKNGTLRPRDVTGNSSLSVWWKCPMGPDHEWSTTVNQRRRHGCPFCSNRRASVTNSLAAVAPRIASEWHPTKNGTLTAHDLTVGSDRRVWWKCPKGPEHEWEATVNSRQYGGCPFCSNRRISSTNSLAVLYPKVASEWHPTKNGDLTPREVTGGATRRVWWRCMFGHDWQAYIPNRTARGNGCPHCLRLRRRKAVATTSKRRQPVHLAEYEGARHGPVRRAT